MNALIVDDEHLAREGLSLMLATYADVRIAGEACDGLEAVTQIQALKPDLVFLDINMPGKNGLEVVEAVGVEHMPRVIFLTAYDEYAIDAFRVNALDYLMKPVNEDRLGESLARARFALAASQPVQAQLGDLLRQLQVDKDNHDRITIRADGHVHFLKPGDIVWVQADGDYVTVHTRERSHLIRATMKAMEEQLAGRGFQRIHRSSIVNLNEIGELVSTDSGDYEVILQDRSSLKLSRTYRDALYRKMAPGSR